MARTLPPNRNTTGTTTVDFGGLSPIDAYGEDIDRPLAYFESTCTDAITTATATLPCLYVHATITAGMSGNISATAGHFQTHIAGTAVGKLTGLASFIEIDTGFVGFTEAVNSSNCVISPLHVGIRSGTGVLHTLSTGQCVFGIYGQYLQSGTGNPGGLYFARINSTNTVTAIFYTDSVAGCAHSETERTTKAGSLAIAYINGSGRSVPYYVNLFVA